MPTPEEGEARFSQRGEVPGDTERPRPHAYTRPRSITSDPEAAAMAQAIIAAQAAALGVDPSTITITAVHTDGNPCPGLPRHWPAPAQDGRLPHILSRQLICARGPMDLMDGRVLFSDSYPCRVPLYVLTNTRTSPLRFGAAGTVTQIVRSHQTLSQGACVYPVATSHAASTQ